MKTTDTIQNFLTGKTFAEEILRILKDNFPEFAKDRQQYVDAMQRLKEGMDGTECPSVQDVMEAIEQQTEAILLFCGSLGAKANLDHFIDPVSKCFLDADSDTYLRRMTFPMLPDHKSAQDTLDRFYGTLSPDQRLIYEDVITYFCHVETAGAYLAHYFGYIYAEEFYSRVIPGYHSDPALTMRYQMILEKYFGKRFLFPD